MPELGPRIYVASLTDYNAGDPARRLGARRGQASRGHGATAIAADAGSSRRRLGSYGDVAEEWRIDDFEGWGHIDINGFESLGTVARLAEGLETYGPAFGAWIEVAGVSDDEALAGFEDHYSGHFASLEEYGEDLLESIGFDLDEIRDIPESLRPYVKMDVEAWVRDMEYGGEVQTVEAQEGGVYVFWNL